MGRRTKLETDLTIVTSVLMIVMSVGTLAWKSRGYAERLAALEAQRGASEPPIAPVRFGVSRASRAEQPPRGCHVGELGLECRFGRSLEGVSRRVLLWACGRTPSQQELDAESATIARASHLDVCREPAGLQRLMVWGAPERQVRVPHVDCLLTRPRAIKHCDTDDTLEGAQPDSDDDVADSSTPEGNRDPMPPEVR